MTLPYFGSRAAVSAFGAVFFSVRTVPHEVAGGSVITIGLHAQLFLTQGSAVFVYRDGIRDRFWAAAFIVQVDKGPYPSALKKAVGGIIIHCGVQTDVFNGNSRQMFFQFIATLVGATNNIISAPTRMQNKRKVFLVTNSISPLLSYAISIPMLLAGYYVVALPLAAVISGLTMEISFWIMNHEWFDPKHFDRKLLKQMLAIAIPLLPNFLIYWVFNSSDKVMITNMIGVGAAGIYSVGSKLGHCSQLIYTAFAGGWQYFAFSTMKDDDQVEVNSKIFEYLGVISFVATAFVCAWSLLIFQTLFTKQYLSGYIIAPYLFLAPLLQMLFQVACNQFVVVKKTWPNMLFLSLGAILNVLLNYLLIPILGIEGAAIATLVGYIVSDVVGVLVLCHIKLMIISRRFIIAVLLMLTFIFTWRILYADKIIISTVGSIILLICYLYLYKTDIEKVIMRKHN